MPARLTLPELQRIKRWQIAHRAEHPVEYHLWDAVLTLWVLGCVSWLPALALEMTLVRSGHVLPGPVCALAPKRPRPASSALRLARSGRLIAKDLINTPTRRHTPERGAKAAIKPCY